MKRRTKYLIIVLLLVLIGYFTAVFLTAYRQQYIHSYLTDEDSRLITEYCEGKDLGIKKSLHPFKGWTPFLLENYSFFFLKVSVLSDPECLTAIMKANSKVPIKKVIYIYDEESGQVIYRIEKLKTKKSLGNNS